MEGGPSHIDLFDPKPLLRQLAGQRMPDSFGSVITAMGESKAPLLADKREWKQHGESGLWISDWVPHTAQMADDLCVVRSVVSDGINHSGGVCQMNTGSIFGGRPSLGAWVNYGLGTENQNLPAFVVIKDTETQVVNGVRNWGAGFMPATYQGVEFEGGIAPIANLTPPKGISSPRQQAKLKFLGKINRDFGAGREDNTELDARIRAYELAFRMQAHAPEAVDLGSETEATRKLYGIDDPKTRRHGPQLPPRPSPRRARRPLHPALPRLRQQVGRPCQDRREPHQILWRTRQARRRTLCAISNHAACSMKPSSSGAASSAAPP